MFGGGGKHAGEASLWPEGTWSPGAREPSDDEDETAARRPAAAIVSATDSALPRGQPQRRESRTSSPRKQRSKGQKCEARSKQDRPRSRRCGARGRGGAAPPPAGKSHREPL
eukprot:1830551-Pyramimonas_sp.AAC.1